MKAVNRTRRARTNKANYMSGEAFTDLKEALEGALAFERRERRDLNVTRIQGSLPPKERDRPKAKPVRAVEPAR